MEIKGRGGEVQGLRGCAYNEADAEFMAGRSSALKLVTGLWWNLGVVRRRR